MISIATVQDGWDDKLIEFTFVFRVVGGSVKCFIARLHWGVLWGNMSKSVTCNAEKERPYTHNHFQGILLMTFHLISTLKSDT